MSDKVEALKKERDETDKYAARMRVLAKASSKVRIACAKAMWKVIDRYLPKEADEDVVSAIEAAEEEALTYKLMCEGARPWLDVYCSFCDAEVASAELREHMERCENHPIAKNKARMGRLEMALKTLRPAFAETLWSPDGSASFDGLKAQQLVDAALAEEPAPLAPAGEVAERIRRRGR